MQEVEDDKFRYSFKAYTNDELIKTLNDFRKELERDIEMYRSYCGLRYPYYIEAVDQTIIKLKELKDGG